MESCEMEEDFYKIWFRHTGDPEPVLHISNYLAKCSNLTRSEVKESLKGDGQNYEITHILVMGDIPLFPAITRTVREICVRGISSIDILKRFQKFKSLENIDLESNNLSAGLPPNTFKSCLKSLTTLNLNDCGLKELPASLLELSFLERLTLEKNVLSVNSVERIFQCLKGLKELNMQGCSLTQLPHSCSPLGQLEVLDVKHNSFSSGLPDDIFISMKSLKKLYLDSCQLRVLPSSLSSLRLLEVCSLSNNNFSAGLPHQVFSSLNSLKSLQLTSNGMTTLPESLLNLTSLEILHLGSNPLKELPEHTFKKLSQVSELYLENCELETLPSSLQASAGTLKVLQLQNNLFSQVLPPVVYQLTRLQRLVLTSNSQLEYLGSDILQLTCLTELDCRECLQLKEPPYQSASGGWERIRQHFEKLVISQRPVTASIFVLGFENLERMEVINLLKQSFACENRLLFDGIEECFQEQRWEVDGCPIRAFNISDDMYVAYKKLWHHDSCVTLLVVDMGQYHEQSRRVGYEEAAKHVLLKYWFFLRHSSKLTIAPILVMTNKGGFCHNEFAMYANKLLECCNNLEQNVIGASTWQHLFTDDSVFLLNKQMNPPLELTCAIKQRVNQAASSQLPLLAQDIVSFVTDEGFSHATSIELIVLLKRFSEFSLSEVEEALKVAQRAGFLVWFSNRSKLSTHIFHRLQVVNKLIQLFFSPNSEQMLEAIYYDSDNEGATLDRKKRKSIEMFRKTAVMPVQLLEHIIKSESDLPTEISIELLKEFEIVLELIIKKDSRAGKYENLVQYMIPSLLPSKTSKDWVTKKPSLRIDVYFDNIPLLKHMYYLLGQSIIQALQNANDSLNIFHNGLKIRRGHWWELQVVYDWNHNCITFLSSIHVESMHNMWKRLLRSVKVVIQTLQKLCPSVASQCRFSCSHCLLVQPHKLEEVSNACFLNSLMENISLSESLGVTFSSDPLYSVTCPSGVGDVPSVLVWPCQDLSFEDQEKLYQFLEKYESNEYTARSTAIKKIAGWLADNENTAAIIMEPKDFYSRKRKRKLDEDDSLPQVYPMSSPRGRALIISNSSSNTRVGSEVDFRNVKDMLSKLDFVVVGEHKDYTAEEMKEAIIQETRLQDHESYKMFFLVLMSHGRKDKIGGCDGPDDEVSMDDLLNLISPKNFPAMTGKPKVVIIQSCSGVNKDSLVDLPDDHDEFEESSEGSVDEDPSFSEEQWISFSNTMNTWDNESIMLSSEASNTEPVKSNRNEILAGDDLLMIKASQPGYVAFRDKKVGSWLIRASVVAFYQYAHQLDLHTLFKMIQQVVARYSANYNYEKKKVEGGYGQIPEIRCRLTHMRKVFLVPEEAVL